MADTNPLPCRTAISSLDLSQGPKRPMGVSYEWQTPFKSPEPAMTNEVPTICYRMDPSKQLLTQPVCPPACASHGEPNTADHPPCLLSKQKHTVLDLEGIRRLALIVTPHPGGLFMDQAWETLSTIRAVLMQHPEPIAVTTQTVFLRNARDAVTCRRLFEVYYQDRMPATNYVLQPPCNGADLAIEAWAVGGTGADIRFHNEHLVTVAYDGLTWIHCAGISPPPSLATAHDQSRFAFEQMENLMTQAGASFHRVVRTWFYQGGITETEEGIERYRELNRARSDFFTRHGIDGQPTREQASRICYPASTGIGTLGLGLAASCIALQTDRQDVKRFPLENPRQTPSCQYGTEYSVKSPRFSRAMAVRIGDYLTTWISGTASIVGSESRHPDDVGAQTRQTIDNIEQLIAGPNFERHGLRAAGVSLADLAKIRVYVKHPEDFELCRSICEERFGNVPTLYAVADICRPELLVEIEGVAFTSLPVK
ncbi:MAG: dioxygenase [Verrucomicrobia bacterium]|nr:dioxygenase [Verrucomicrobiota bacterium]